MGCIIPVGGAPLAMGWGRGGGADDTSGGDTPTGRGGRGSGGTPERGAAMGGMGGMGGMVGMGGMPGEKQTCSADMIVRRGERELPSKFLSC